MTPNTAVRERPILFSGPMVRAILDGSKTQTRRVVQQKAVTQAGIRGVMSGTGPAFGPCPYGQPGDRLWVRESFCDHGYDAMCPDDPAADLQMRKDHIEYRECHEGKGWTSPLFMPRWASRLTLEITEVRIHRLQEISYADVMAEGCPTPGSTLASPEDHDWYIRLWDSLNAKRGHSWESNPFVWAVSFRRPPEEPLR